MPRETPTAMLRAGPCRAAWPLVLLLLAACQPLATPPDAEMEQLPELIEEPVPVCECPEPEPLICPEPEPSPPVPLQVCPEPLVMAPPPEVAPNTFDGKMVLGGVEYVHIEPGPLKLQARIDSGATTSSLHAEDIVRFERDGQSWVRFRTYDRADAREPVTIELPLSRRVRIKTLTDEVDQRPVVEVNIRLGQHTERVEVTLVDRSNFAFSVLIGRNFLRDVAVIDVSREFVQGR